MVKKLIKVYTAEHCRGCKEVSNLLSSGQFESNIEDASVDLIDIETEEGFKEVAKEGLTGVPSAKYNGKSCKIQIDETNEIVILTCEEGDSPVAPVPDKDN
jgi:glutaredoxin